MRATHVIYTLSRHGAVPISGGLCDGPEVQINGRVGWALGENMVSGSIVVEGPAGSLTGAALRGGDIVVKGNVGARTGIDQKGGTIITLGKAGINTGFMMQRGRQIIRTEERRVGKECRARWSPDQ